MVTEKALKSKIFKVYIYQGDKGGGNIIECDSQGKTTSKQHQFNNKKEAMKNFGEILDKYCK